MKDKGVFQVPYISALALHRAPQEVSATFRKYFALFVHVLRRHQQLISARFKIGFTSCLEDERSNIDPNDENIDKDRVICLCSETISKFLLRPGQWIRICKFDDSKSTNVSTRPEFTCQILPMTLSQVEVSNENCGLASVCMNPVTEYNLRRALRIPPFMSIPDLQILPMVTDPVLTTPNKSLAFAPIQGKSVKLTRLNSLKEVEQQECDLRIENLFVKSCKYVCIGDIISIKISNTNYLDLVVSELNGKTVNDGCRELFKISKQSTSVFLNLHAIHEQFHRPLIHKLVAPCLENPFNTLCSRIRQALISNYTNCENSIISSARADLWPNFLLYGPVGCGKTSVCQAVSSYFGMNFYLVNASNFIGDTSAYSEAKFRGLFDKLTTACPALVFVKNVHLLGKDKEGTEDKRSIIAINEFLADISTTSVLLNKQDKPMSSKAIFIVGSTDSPNAVLPRISQNFPFKFEMPQTCSIAQIESTLLWQLEKADVSLDDEIDMKTWVLENCDGMTKCFGDLKAMVACAVRQAFTRNSDSLKWNSSDDNLQGHLKIKQDDLEMALNSIDAVLQKAASTVEIPKVNWEDIGGLENVKKELIGSVRLPLEFPHLFASGIRRSGILLYGPPGTGKTLIAKAVATEFKLSFLSVKGPELLNMYVGQSEQNVRDIFTKARNAAPCIVFFDELDALAPNRGRAGDSGGVMDRVVSQILAELDGTQGTPGVFIIGATNRPDLIDSALLRPGRFDKLLYVGMNDDIESKISVLKAVTRKFHFNEDVDLNKIASLLSKDMSGADIYSLCSDAYMTAVERHIHLINQCTKCDVVELSATEATNSKVFVTLSDFEAAITRASASLSEVEQAKYKTLKEMQR